MGRGYRKSFLGTLCGIIVAILAVVLAAGALLQFFGEGKMKPSEWFKKECVHEYAEGSHVCTICGAVSAHEYAEGSHECTICGELSAHEYAEGSHVCTICGEVSVHEYAEGSHECTICGELSDHEYAEGSHVCTICGAVSEHEYAEGSHECTVCGEKSKHEYENDVCTICGINRPVHTVTYIVNGGTSQRASRVKDRDTLAETWATETQWTSGELGAPVRTDYRFMGWYKDSSFIDLIDPTTEEITRPITLYARWARIQYTVTFMSNGAVYQSSMVYSGNSASVPVSPTRPADEEWEYGYTFAGWYVDEAFETKYGFGAVTDNVTVYAKWTKNEPVFITVTFETNGGSEIEPQQVVEGHAPVEPETPTRPGYTFKGWFSNSKCTKVFNFDNALYLNATVYAKWAPIYYTISFALNGATSAAISSQELRYGDTVSVPNTPAKTGFTFGGWYDNAECNGIAFDFATPVTGEFTLYAKWLCETHTYAENSHVCTVCGYVSEADYSGDSYGNVCSICGGYRIEYNIRSEIKAAYPQLFPTCAKAGETMSFTLPETMTAKKNDGVIVQLTDITFSAENYMSYGGSPIACARTGNTWEFTVPTIAEGNYIVIYIGGTVEEILPEGFYKLSYETVGSFSGGVDCPGYGKAGETVTVQLYPAFDPIQGTSTPINSVVLDTAQSVGIAEINVTISESGEATVTFTMPAQEAKLVVTVS